MALYPVLCGLTAAAFSGYFPLMKVDPKAPEPVKSLTRLMNGGLAFFLASTVSQLALSALETITKTKFISQQSQVILFGASCGFVFGMPRVEKFIKGLVFGHPRRSDFRGDE